jgi:O-antigen biosynthesis protein
MTSASNMATNVRELRGDGTVTLGMPPDAGSDARESTGTSSEPVAFDDGRLAEMLACPLERLVELMAPLYAPAPRAMQWGDDAAKDPAAYRAWVDGHEKSRTELPRTGPRISVVVPIYQPDLAFLARCLESVHSQTYVDWELCLCDDGSDDRSVTAFVARFARRMNRRSTQRVRFVADAANGGIAHATNRAISIATGAYVAFLDQDDTLHPEALGQIAAALQRTPGAEVIYSDEDKIGVDDLVFDPAFKPDWAPSLLLSFPYLGHLLVVRRDLIHAVGGLRSEFDGSQDYDLMLRTTERAEHVVHVAEVLYHWRTIPGSAAASSDAKPWAHAASRRALQEAVARRHIDATVEDTGFAPGWYHVRRKVRGHPSVSVIIPFRDQAAMTARCVASLAETADYDNVEFVLVDNASNEPESMALRRRLVGQGTRVLEYPERFNWSAINNMAADVTDTDLLLFMNNDIEATKPGWLSALVELAQVPEVGVVGARLTYPDGTVQHAGIVLGLGGIAGHVLAGLPAGRHGYLGYDAIVRPYSAVTGACMMSRREVFRTIGGFDETLDVAFGDVDYCMRSVDAGLGVLYTPHAELIHHESVSRGMSGWTSDVGPFLNKWGRERFWVDPMYNPNLDLFASWCPLRTPNERVLWDLVVDRYVTGGVD